MFNAEAVPVMLVPTKADGVPKFGVTKVGEVFITNVEPVPVCEATDVVFPTEVIAPVKFAFVVATTPVSAAPLPEKLVAVTVPEIVVFPFFNITKALLLEVLLEPFPIENKRSAPSLELGELKE